MEKITLKKQQLRQRLFDSGLSTKDIDDLLTETTANPTSLPKWLVILLKALAYGIGLILAGYGTTAAAQTLIHF